MVHVPTGVFQKVRKAWQAWKQREANRSALLQGAIAAATYSGATVDQAVAFAHRVIGASGPRPEGLRKKFKWKIGGGPPPDWPDWKDWVRRLGAAAYAEWVADPVAAGSWTPTKSRAEFAKSYVAEVMNYLGEDKSNQANLTVLGLIHDSDRRREEARRDRLKRLIISASVLTAVGLGGAAGHFADVEAHMPVPDATAVGVTAAVCATVAAVFASRPRQSQTLSALAAQSDNLKSIQREVRSPLRQVVDGVVKVVNSDLCASPFGEGLLLTETIAMAVDFIHQQAGQNSEGVTLTLYPQYRDKIRTASDDLVRKAEDQGLVTVDRMCMGHIRSLANALRTVTRFEDSVSPRSEHRADGQREPSPGDAFWIALIEAWDVADHIEGRAPGSEPPERGSVRLKHEGTKAT